MAKTITLKLRIKDTHAHRLNMMAGAVNYVWNHINALSSRFIKEKGRFISSYELMLIQKGQTKRLGCIAKPYKKCRESMRLGDCNIKK